MVRVLSTLLGGQSVRRAPQTCCKALKLLDLSMYDLALRGMDQKQAEASDAVWHHNQHEM